MDITDLTVDLPRVVSDLSRLVAIPSVSADGFPPEEVRRSAEAVAELLATAGADRVELLELGDAHPAVWAEADGPDAAPTVLLYAHHDVQPPGPLDRWTTLPFEATPLRGRLYGRGTADDKGGVVVHAAVLRALRELPVTVRILVEGEEEIGSRHLAGFLDAYRDRLSADVLVIADAGNAAPGVPALTTSLRGLVDGIVEVRVLEDAVHSGLFGGAFPDALTVLARLLATLHDDAGRVAVEGLGELDRSVPELAEDDLRRQAGVLAGVRTIGDGPLAARLWYRPAISVLGIDAPGIESPINQLVPVARAVVSLRVAPGDDPARAMEALRAHLTAHTPWGAEVRFVPGSTGEPFLLEGGGPGAAAFRSALAAAYGRAPVDLGMGGSIPFVAAYRERHPQAEVLLTGVADPTSAIHGPDESVEIADLERAIRAEAAALQMLGR